MTVSFARKCNMGGERRQTMRDSELLQSYPQASARHWPVDNFGVRALVGLAAFVLFFTSHWSLITSHSSAEAATYQFTPTAGQLVVGRRLAGHLREADQMTAVIERDGEVAKQAHAANAESTMRENQMADSRCALTRGWE